MSDNYISRYSPAPCQLLLKRVRSLKVGERSLVRILGLRVGDGRASFAVIRPCFYHRFQCDGILGGGSVRI